MPLTLQKIEPVSKKDRIVASLREAMISGAIRSGEQIVEGKVAQQLGVGQGVIREALLTSPAGIGGGGVTNELVLNCAGPT